MADIAPVGLQNAKHLFTREPRDAVDLFRPKIRNGASKTHAQSGIDVAITLQDSADRLQALIVFKLMLIN